MLLSEIEAHLDEGIHDKYIFKAVFSAGGPGSGKSTVTRKLLAPLGFRPVDIDQFIEMMGKRGDVDLKAIEYGKESGRELLKKTYQLASKRRDLFLDGRIPIIVDSTGRNFDRIKQNKAFLAEFGYESALLYVNTSLEVALERNKARARTVDPDFVTRFHKEVSDNIGKFQNEFKQNFFIIDNTDGFDLKEAYRKILPFLNRPVNNPQARQWIAQQKS